MNIWETMYYKYNGENDMNTPTNKSQFNIIAINSAAKVKSGSQTTSGANPGLGDAVVYSVLEDKYYTAPTINDIFKSNPSLELDSFYKIYEVDKIPMVQMDGRALNSRNAQLFLREGEKTNEYLKLIIYTPLNLSPADQLRHRDVVAKSIEDFKMPTIYANKGKTNPVQVNIQGNVPYVLGPIHVNQANEPHYELNILNRALTVIRDSNNKITSVKTSPVLKITENDYLESLQNYINSELINAGFNEGLTTTNFKEVSNNINTPSHIQTATQQILKPSQPEPNPVEDYKKSQAIIQKGLTAPYDDEINFEEEESKAPETESVAKTVTSPILQEELNAEIEKELSEKGIDKTTINNLMNATASLETGLDLESNTGGFKDSTGISILLNKAKVATQKAITEQMLEIEKNRRDYQILEISEKLIEQNKNLNETLNTTKNQLASTKDILEKQIEANQAAQESLLKASQELSVKDSQINKLQSENKEFEIGLRKLNKSHDESIAALSEKLTSVKELMAKGFEERNGKIEKLSVANESLSADLIDSQNRISDLENAISEQAKDFESKLSAQQKQHNEIVRDLNKTIEDKETEINNANKAKNEAISDKNKIIRESADKLLNVETEHLETLRSLNEQHAKAVKEAVEKAVAAAVKIENDKLKDFENEVKDKNKVIASQLNTMKTTHKETIANKDKEIEELKKALQEMNNGKKNDPKIK